MPSENRVRDLEKNREYCKAYYWKNAEKLRAKMKNWRNGNRERFNASRFFNRDKTKYLAFLAYSIGGKIECRECGQNDLDVLVLDHKNDDGASHRKILKMASRGNTSGGGVYFILRKHKYPDGLQILCANCNMKKEAMRHHAHRLKNKYYADRYDRINNPTQLQTA